MFANVAAIFFPLRLRFISRKPVRGKVGLGLTIYTGFELTTIARNGKETKHKPARIVALVPHLTSTGDPADVK